MEDEPIEAYPLQWPSGWPRTRAPERNWRFKGHTIASSRDNLIKEVSRLISGGRAFRPYSLIISTNQKLRNDGLPYSRQGNITDPGVAVYFKYKGKQVCLACDKWDRIEHNMHSITRTIYALRQIERDGSTDMLDRAFTGFTALPAPPAKQWWEVLEVDPNASTDKVKEAYRAKVRKWHPDNGGTAEAFRAVQQAYEDSHVR